MWIYPGYDGYARAGFTYLELLIAITIMAAGLIPVLNLMTEGMDNADFVERATRSALLAQAKVDEIRNLALGSDPSYGFDVDYTESSSAFPAPDDKFRYTVTDSNRRNIKDISLVVWFDGDMNGDLDDGEAFVNLDTRIARRE